MPPKKKPRSEDPETSKQRRDTETNLNGTLIDFTLQTNETQQVPISPNQNENETNLDELLREIEKLREEKIKLLEETKK